MSTETTTPSIPTPLPPIDYVGYESEHQLAGMMALIENDLSEPYSIYTYRYFLHQWPKLSFLIVLETEYTNTSAIALYQQMGFIKEKRLYRYYLNGVDAFRLKLFCNPPTSEEEDMQDIEDPQA
ncbi:hypothetical protein BGZ94_000794 [Podila epigama]|nr:hypothetical protein BGZ94_000794 [Podila epigama]